MNKKLIVIFEALIMLLMLAACTGEAVPEQVAAAGLSFGETAVTVFPGEVFTPELTVSPSDFTESLYWSSSDEAVAQVSGEGEITALRVGSACVSVSGSDVRAEIRVSVEGSVTDSAAEAISALTVSACDDGVWADALELTELLGRSDEPFSAELCELMTRITGCAQGDCDREALDAAIDALPDDFAVSDEFCRIAALSCAARGEQEHSAVITLVGDCTFGMINERRSAGGFPGVYERSGSVTYPFDKVRGIFACDSMTIANFEGTLTESRSFRQKAFYFRGDAKYAKILSGSSVEAVSLANNHSGDYFSCGYSDTVSALKSENIDYCSNSKIITYTVDSQDGPIRVAVVGYYPIFDFMAEDMLKKSVAQIEALAADDTVIIMYPHWGVEKHMTPSKWQLTFARQLIDAGADLVIGHHTHTLQGIEKYGDSYIAYSLGNFAFGGNPVAESPETVILRARLGYRDGVAAVEGISVIPCSITSASGGANNYQPRPLFGDEGDGVIDTLLKRSASLPDGITSVDRPEI